MPRSATAPKPSRLTTGETRPAYQLAAGQSDAPLRALLDVNVLIALLDAAHLHHRRASDWLADNLAAGWASCAITQNGCVRILSQPSYPNALATARVAERLRAATLTRHHRYIGESASLLDPMRYDTERLLGHRAVTDAYLLGLAVEHGLRFVTFDTAVPVRAVRGALPRHLVVL